MEDGEAGAGGAEGKEEMAGGGGGPPPHQYPMPEPVFTFADGSPAPRRRPGTCRNLINICFRS